MKNSNAGKGSSPRHFSVPLGSFNNNFEKIFGTGEVVSYQRDGKTPAYLDECPNCRGFGDL